MIEIYASRLSDEGKETYKIRKPQTMAEWLYRHGISRDIDLGKLAISLYVNGERLLPRQWKTTRISAEDKVEIYREPKGTDPFTITFALIFAATAAIALLTPKIPGISASRSTGGNPLDQGSSKGNKVKINDVRPELFGYNPQRFPDYLIPPRAYFASLREPRTEMCLGVGQGSYQIDLEDVKTGQTPLLSLGADASFTIHAPGADISSEPAHFFWYTAPEVGASNTGAAGLELTVETTLTASASASVFTFNGDVVGIPVGAGTFPADWVAGTLINPVAPYSFTIDDGTGTGGRDVINGPIAQFNFVIGDEIQIIGDNEGFYVVSDVTATTLELDYEGGAPGVGLVIGPVVMGMSYRGFRFRILSYAAQALQVKRLTAGGADDDDWPGWDSLSSNVAQVRLDSSNLQGGYRGPFPACPEGEVVTDIEFDMFFPSGIVGLGSQGEYIFIQANYSFEYRDMAIGGAWTAATFFTINNSLDAIGKSHRVALPYSMRPECRMKKLNIPQGSLRPEEIHDVTMWLRLKGLVQTSSPGSYPGMTVMTCDIRGGDRISSQSESLVNLACTRILPVLRGGVWQDPEPTREISAAVGHIIRNVGYSDTADIDLVELDRLESTRWTPRGDTYDRIVMDSKTVKSNLLDALSVGFSELTIDRGLLVPVRDEPRGPSFDHVYNPHVMLEPLSYEFTMPDQPDDFDGVDVEYYDHVTKQDETVECRLSGDAGERVEKLKLEGVGNRTKAWRIGMRRRRGHIYRQRQYSFKTELDALNSAYFDYVALGVATPGYGQSAEVVSYSPSPYTPGNPITLEVSQPLDWSVPGVHKVVVRRLDGSASGPYVATYVDDYTFTIPTLDFVPNVSGNIDTPPIIQFGHESTWAFPALITDVSPSGTRTCSVKAVNYDVRMYADDDAFPPS
jgi:hypothetical protein